MAGEERPWGRIALAAGLAGLALFFLASTAIVGPLLLLLFAGVLLAIFFRGLGDLFARLTGLSENAAYVVVVLSLVMLSGAGTWLLTPYMIDQGSQLLDKLPALIAQSEAFLSESQLGRQLLDELRAFMGENGESAGPVTGLLAITFEVVVYAAIVFVTGIYLSANPRLYVEGIVRLVSPPRRALARRTLAAMDHTLRWYLIGRAASMLAVGALTALGLWLLGVPLSMLLGTIAGLLTFVPYVGPIVGGVPIALVALLESPALLVWAIIYYTAVQSIEGFLITPLVQQRVIMLAPAITIAAELIMGVLFGAIGVILSVPFVAAVMVFIRVVYVDALLERRPDMQTAADEAGAANGR